jgi:hypothetical protein
MYKIIDGARFLVARGVPTTGPAVGAMAGYLFFFLSSSANFLK